MSQPNPSTALARVLVDELARNGIDYAVISPGSRSGALALAAAGHADIETRVVIDERSAAFHAMGRSKATGTPTMAISTSGTAPANYLPAVVEADMSLVPLVIVSADRPAEMRGVGANQTIDQVGLYGSKVRFSADIEAASGSEDLNAEWRSAAAQAAAAASGSGSPPGPVHLNVAFREPTVPVSDDGRSVAEPYPFGIEGRPNGAPWIDRDSQRPADFEVEVPSFSRGLLIAGEGVYDTAGISEQAAALGWPLLATALSGMRGKEAISSYHHLLASGVPESLRPDLVLAIGALGPSERLEDLVASARYRLRVDPTGRIIDPRRNASRILAADPVRVLERFEAAGQGQAWREGWAELDLSLREAFADYLHRVVGMSGAHAVKAIDAVSWRTLVVASSLPIREVDAQLSRRGRVIANRGASGIDGFVSTALGVASALPDTVALAGDLSLLHDSGGFLCETPNDLVMVVLDNDGGGLFDSLPQARHSPQFERLFTTPHGRKLELIADLHGLGYGEADTVDGLRKEIERRLGDGVHIVRIPVDRSHDLVVRRELDEIGSRVARSGQA